MAVFNYDPFLIVVSAPSGTGKTTVCHRAIQQLDDIRFSISHTTRAKRPNEVDGKDYHFVDVDTFESKQRNNAFLEWANVYGNLYGTSTEEIERARQEGEDLLVEIDVQGARQIMRRREVVSVFVLPPSLAIVEQRLRARDTDSEDEIRRRLAEAETELHEANDYDYWVINEDLDTAAGDLVAIVRAERIRRERMAPDEPLAQVLKRGSR